MTHSRLGHRHGGAVLIVTLLFLVILTMLGVTAMTGTTMEERMAGNTRDSQLALQAAEAAMRDARRDINNWTVKTGTGFGRGTPLHAAEFGDDAGNPGTCNATKPGICRPANNPNGTPYSKSPGTILPSVPASYDLTGPPSVEYGQITGAEPIGGTALAAQPRYLMEAFCLQQFGDSLSVQLACNFIRVTAAGYGRNPNTVVRLQEIFVRE
jgi:type IV pilus assembly protein PilX